MEAKLLVEFKLAVKRRKQVRQCGEHERVATLYCTHTCPPHFLSSPAIVVRYSCRSCLSSFLSGHHNLDLGERVRFRIQRQKNQARNLQDPEHCRQTYVDIREHTRELCGRLAAAPEGKGPVCSCPHLAHIAVTLIISNRRFSLLDPDIP